MANLSLENGAWRLQWHDNLILPELTDGSSLVSDRQAPARGDIYDSNGDAVVTQSDAVELGVVAGQIPSDKQKDLFIELWRLTGVSVADIQSEYDSYNNNGQYVPIGEASKADVNARIGVLSAYSGLKMTAYTSRFAALPSQSVGYTQPIPAEKLSQYLRLGYSLGQRVGQIGIEKWGEQYLAGRDEATLYIVDPSGKVGTTIAHVDGQAADSITLTIDKNLQQQAQLAMDGLPGAIVVIERDTGRVLAMVSSPGLDANLFDSNNDPEQYQPYQCARQPRPAAFEPGYAKQDPARLGLQDRHDLGGPGKRGVHPREHLGLPVHVHRNPRPYPVRLDLERLPDSICRRTPVKNAPPARHFPADC